MTDRPDTLAQQERTFNPPALLRVAAANDDYLREHWNYLAPIALLAHAKWAEADRLSAELEQRTQERDVLLESEQEWQRRGDRSIAAEERVRKLEAAQLETLAFFYALTPVAVARLCDTTLDPSGALLGRVREAAVDSDA